MQMEMVKLLQLAELPGNQCTGYTLNSPTYNTYPFTPKQVRVGSVGVLGREVRVRSNHQRTKIEEETDEVEVSSERYFQWK